MLPCNFKILNISVNIKLKSRFSYHSTIILSNIKPIINSFRQCTSNRIYVAKQSHCKMHFYKPGTVIQPLYWIIPSRKQHLGALSIKRNVSLDHQIKAINDYLRL